MPAFDREVLGVVKTNLIIVFPTSITYLVQACQPSLACCDLRSLTQIQIPSPYQLPSAYPAHGCQEGCPLTIIAPGQNGLLLHCQDRSLFRSLGSSDDTDGPIRVWATLSRNFVSHIRKSHRTGFPFPESQKERAQSRLMILVPCISKLNCENI